MEQLSLEKLLQKMTLKEKIGQLVQVTPQFFSESGEVTGPMQEWDMTAEERATIGSVLGTHTLEEVQTIQTWNLENSRLKIPLLFMADVIHGYKIIFPIPLAMACSFDPDLIQEVARLSALEATSQGIHVTFSPMADLVRDARWGRVLESNGEDPYLSARITEAYVKGYQGESLRDKDTVAACVKHFIGYGEVTAGRDYHKVDISDIELHQNHLPAFQAAIDAGARMVMSSFTLFRSVPATANTYLLRTILREKLKFNGIIISDWGAVGEIVAHRVAQNKTEATKKAIIAGIDIDMMTDSYCHHLQKLVENGTIDVQLIDQAVLNVLTLKNDLGLFEDPYRAGKQLQDDSMKQTIRNQARKTATESMVLLKNENVLPLSTKEHVYLVGEKINSGDLLGAWSWIGNPNETTTIQQSLQQKNANITFVTNEVNYTAISSTDKVVIVVGESSEEAGEAASKTNISLSQKDIALIRNVYAQNKNIIVVLISGRPMDITPIEPYAKAILVAWFPGSEGGSAISDILYGVCNPSGKLAMSFPRSVGQLPLYYSELSTGRPLNEQNQHEKYVSKYLDCANTPLYPFGHGLNYSDIRIEDIQITHTNKAATITCTLNNHSDIAGNEVLQVYVEDCFAEVARPKKELKAFQKVFLEANQQKQVVLQLDSDAFAYYHTDLSYDIDPGEFNIFVGFSSDAPFIQTISIL